MADRSSWGFSAAGAMDWRVGAACRDTDPDAWIVTGTPTGANQMALRVCAGCPVRRECYGWYESLPADLRKSVIAGGVRWDDSGAPRRAPVPLPAGLVPARDVARALGVVPQTVSMWCATGKLPGVRDGRGRWLIDAEDVNRRMKARDGDLRMADTEQARERSVRRVACPVCHMAAGKRCDFGDSYPPASHTGRYQAAVKLGLVPPLGGRRG